jgi:hypothetical protein
MRNVGHDHFLSLCTQNEQSPLVDNMLSTNMFEIAE